MGTTEITENIPIKLTETQLGESETGNQTFERNEIHPIDEEHEKYGSLSENSVNKMPKKRPHKTNTEISENIKSNIVQVLDDKKSLSHEMHTLFSVSKPVPEAKETPDKKFKVSSIKADKNAAGTDEIEFKPLLEETLNKKWISETPEGRSTIKRLSESKNDKAFEPIKPTRANQDKIEIQETQETPTCDAQLLPQQESFSGNVGIQKVKKPSKKKQASKMTVGYMVQEMSAETYKKERPINKEEKTKPESTKLPRKVTKSVELEIIPKLKESLPLELSVHTKPTSEMKEDSITNELQNMFPETAETMIEM